MQNRANDNAKKIIASALGSVLILSIFGIAGFGVYKSRQQEQRMIDLDRYWEEAFRAEENNKVGIVFNSINTTADEYAELKTCCDAYESNNKTADKIVSVDVGVVEDMYIDNVQDSTEASLDKVDTDKVTTGYVYFDNAIMTRYINDKGELKVILAKQEGESVGMYGQKEILEKGLYKYTDYTENDDTRTSYMSEEAYINELNQAITSVLLSDNAEAEYEALKVALSYFSVDGKKALLVCNDSIEKHIGTADGVELKTAVAGKSDVGYISKDIVYMQFEAKHKEKVQYINLIVKLNRNLRVFDIDIV